MNANKSASVQQLRQLTLAALSSKGIQFANSCLCGQDTERKIQMAASYREMVEFIDPVKIPSARTLNNLLRHRSAPVTESLSMGKMLTRLTHPGRITQTLLFYNTYLLPGFELPVRDWILEAVVPDVPWIPDPGDVIQELIKPILPDGKVRIQAKPILSTRAREIGQVLMSEGVDIIALCEVFSEHEGNLILQSRPSSSTFDFEVGPNDNGAFVQTGSGLVTISKQRRVSRVERHKFGERGSRYRDSDAWANKGVLMTEIDLGFARGGLEIYSTHLFAGGGLPNLPDIDEIGLDQDLPPEKKAKIKVRQVDELVDFIRETHDSSNVAIVVGDFNIDAHENLRIDINGVRATAYEHVVKRMRAIDMVDLWDTRNGTYGYTQTEVDEIRNVRDISNLPDPPILVRDVCHVDAQDSRYCDDNRYFRHTGRIDHVFVELQKPEQAILVDFGRPRRRPFFRSKSAPDYESMQTLSDHLGLEISVAAIPV